MYDSALYMIREFSFGIIPLKSISSVWHTLLVKHERASHWAYPKGHAEKGESPEEVAQREMEEETGLKLKRFFALPPLIENYQFKVFHQVHNKTVTYFLAEVEGEVHIQVEEIADYRWVPLVQAEAVITFKEGKRICREAIELLEFLN